MPFFVIVASPSGMDRVTVLGPFEGREQAEAARAEATHSALSRLIEAADRATAEALAREAFSPSPDA